MSEKENKNVEMRPINKLVEAEMKDLMLAEGDETLIWFNEDQSGRTVFINIGNATVSMPEQVFYELTKLTQTAAKKLLGID